MAETTERKWEYRQRRNLTAPFKSEVQARYQNDDSTVLELRCSCGASLDYNFAAALSELNEAMAEHILSHDEGR